MRQKCHAIVKEVVGPSKRNSAKYPVWRNFKAI
jgi:hypothetical protein